MAGPSGGQSDKKGRSFRRARRTVPAFLEKLVNMLETAPSSLICWDKDGTTFLVLDPIRFAKEVLPKFYNTSNFSSFVRQLNFYSFHKVVEDSRKGDTTKSGERSWKFMHKRFLRGRLDLLPEIKRKTYQDDDAPKREEFSALRQEVTALNSKVASLEKNLSELRRMLVASTAGGANYCSAELPNKKRKITPPCEPFAFVDLVDIDADGLVKNAGEPMSTGELGQFLEDLEFGSDSASSVEDNCGSGGTFYSSSLNGARAGALTCAQAALLAPSDESGRAKQQLWTWVECDACKKWRKLPPSVEAESLPEKWDCTMNRWDPHRATCLAPQEEATTTTNCVKVEGGHAQKKEQAAASRGRDMRIKVESSQMGCYTIESSQMGCYTPPRGMPATVKSEAENSEAENKTWGRSMDIDIGNTFDDSDASMKSSSGSAAQALSLLSTAPPTMLSPDPCPGTAVVAAQATANALQTVDPLQGPPPQLNPQATAGPMPTQFSSAADLPAGVSEKDVQKLYQVFALMVPQIQAALVTQFQAAVTMSPALPHRAPQNNQTATAVTA